MRIFIFLILLTFTFGCATRNINYDRNIILKKYSSEYKFIVDNEQMDLESVFLDKDNIEKVLIDKRKKEIRITQIKQIEFFLLKNLCLDSLSAVRKSWDKKKNEIIIIDGKVLNDSLKEKIKIDTHAIKDFRILRGDDLTGDELIFYSIDKDYIMISTK